MGRAGFEKPVREVKVYQYCKQEYSETKIKVNVQYAAISILCATTNLNVPRKIWIYPRIMYGTKH